MSPIISRQVSSYQEVPALTGAGLLGIVTSGMYDNPLSIYREYIQNATDAVAGSWLQEKPSVSVSIDALERRVRIRDNGPGLTRKVALERLLPIGRSNKRLGADRGFRGIGRLAGLAFARSVSFTTRTSGEQTVTRIIWHRDKLPDPDLASTELELEEAILSCVEVQTLPGLEFPDHFFEVELHDVARHSAGLLLNREIVREYIGEVCPVPMGASFPFTKMVEDLFLSVGSPLSLEILLEGDQFPIERPYVESIRLSANKVASYEEFQVIRIPSIDGNGEAAVGWIAHSSYLGAIPKAQRVRGIRARVGNIQIGDDSVFEDLFTEERFNRWCVGELHILDSRIVPNARRDYFQPGPHLRNLENQLTPILRQVIARCRRESTARNRLKKALSALYNSENLYALATSGYLTTENSARLVQEALNEVEDLRTNIGEGTFDNGTLERLNVLEEQLKNYSANSESQQFAGMSGSQAATLQTVFGVLASRAPSPESARDLIESVLEETTTIIRNTHPKN